MFVGSSKQRIKEFPEEACDTAGHQLWLVQQGKNPDDWKPMPSIGQGVREIRIHQPHAHRVIYTAHFWEAVYVLHAFEKKTNKTSPKDLDLARKVYAQIKANRTRK